MENYRYKITIEYDGTPFYGWQRQNGDASIQQHLEEALIPIARDRTVIFGCGRTDAGVHAIGQVAHFDLSKDWDCYKIKDCMNGYLKDVPIVVLSVENAHPEFDARYGAIERTYMYRILNRRERPCIDRNRAWWVIKHLDVEKMHSIAQILIGTHDFSSFRAAGCQSISPIKTIHKISFERIGAELIFRIAAKSFLYHQVRNIVGTLYFVGTGEWSENDFAAAFSSCDRTKAGQTAPACGLYFCEAKYADPKQ